MPDYMNEMTVEIEPAEDKDKYYYDEIQAYLERGKEKYGKHLTGITIKAVPDEPDMVDIYYDVKTVPFSRLRRITGYLVGDMNRWNNAKLSEEHDRVKHDI